MFTGCCEPIENFAHGAAASDDVAVVAGVLLGVGAAKKARHLHNTMKSYALLKVRNDFGSYIYFS